MLSTTALACRDEERLRFGYTARDGSRTDRSVEPHRLVSVGHRWYLVAWDLGRQDWRSFRLDRLRDPVTNGMRFRPPEVPGGDAAAFVQEGIASAVQRHHVSVVLRTGADDVRRVVGSWGGVEELDGDRSRLTMEVDDFGCTVMVLAAVGADFEVEEPDELRVRLRELGELLRRSV